ncbi:MAG: dockerin type I domain-containing protein [Deltaproteobacteria bacterium]|nr:dockerin type I domain-containing protein [Deltaproteobacteria bacterium]
MKRTTRILVWLFIGIFINLLLAGSAWCQSSSDVFLNIKEAELWIKVVVTENYDSAYDSDSEHDEQHDRLDLTVEGTYKFKKYELPVNPGMPDIYPKMALLVEDTKKLNISGSGGGNRYSRRLQGSCEPVYEYPCKSFLIEDINKWNYETANPVYDEHFLSGLEIKQESENAPLQFNFQINGPFDEHFTEYIVSSGTYTNIYRQWTGTTTETTPIQDYGPASSGSPWSDWVGPGDGGSVSGDLTFEGDQFAASGRIVYPYSYVSGGITNTGKVEIFYRLNPQPGVKDIQVNQALGRYKYVDESHYVPATHFASGKETVVQVFYSQAVPVGELSGVTVDVLKDGSSVCTLSDSEKDLNNNALIFRPQSRADCGNWQAGTYEFKVKLNDVEDSLTNVQFQDRRKLKVLAVPVKANYGGVIKTPGDQWKKGGKFMRQVYPVAYKDLTYDWGALYDASGADYDIATEPGQKKLWQALDGMAGAYDLVIGFIDTCLPDDTGALTIQGYTYGPKATIVVNSDEDMPSTVAHEVAHLFQLGDEYNGGGYNLAVNPPPFGYAGHIRKTTTPVTATDPNVKPFPGGSGSLIAKELHPYETGGRRLLKDNLMCFMGSGVSQNSNWISPAVWKSLFQSFASSAASSASSTRTPADVSRVVEAFGWISQTGTVTLSLPWNVSTVEGTPNDQGGTYVIQALDSDGAVLGREGFTPAFVTLSNPPRAIDPAPFSRVVVPFPAGTVKFRIVDASGSTVGELPVSPNAPAAAVTAPGPGENIAGAYTITWTASDGDGDSLYYTVEYSADGQKWRTLATQLTATSFAADFSNLPGGSQARIRVTASDGINGTSAESGTFTVPIKAGEAFIDSPAADSTHRMDSGIIFQGSAHDPQEGEILDDAKLVWTSDRDGLIGTGSSVFKKSNLSAGQHVITLTATNSLGQAMSRSVTIQVLPPLAPPGNPGIQNGATGVSIDPQLTWQAAPGAISYALYLWKEGETKPTTPTMSDVKSTTATLAEVLSPLTAYHWQVAAGNDSAWQAGAEWSFTTGNILVGDVNDDKAVNLLDAILSLQVLAIKEPAPGIRTDYDSSGSDMNRDGQISPADIIYILQKAAGMR